MPVPLPIESPEAEPISRVRRITSRISALYYRNEKYSGIAIFCLGFLWDSLTLTRVDNLFDNLFLLFYLIIIGIMIIFTLRRQCGAVPPKWIQKIEPHFSWAMQFCFGGLFSSYVVFYFKSSSWSRTQFFFMILVFLLIANEFLQNRLQNRVLLALLYSFCLLSFLAFFLPVVMAAVNERIFQLAELMSFLFTIFVFFMGLCVQRDNTKRHLAPIAAWVGVLILSVNTLYFANLIPPVPLALKDAGIYHSVVKTSAGYRVQYVPPSIWRFWKKSDSPFYWSPGERVYCYTAVFAPAKVRGIPVRHVWSFKAQDGWRQTDRLGFEIALGGREGGYRGYTAKRGIWPGKWRVEVQTLRGQTLGHITFDVVPGPVPHPPLQTRLIR
ncbi:MAG: DUF2914 domain-containing protein [Acidobacteria bacterium]|nr:DUF2914 domain-containing protein [Acidobacteriota bacterium]